MAIWKIVSICALLELVDQVCQMFVPSSPSCPMTAAPLAPHGRKALILLIANFSSIFLTITFLMASTLFTAALSQAWNMLMLSPAANLQKTLIE